MSAKRAALVESLIEAVEAAPAAQRAALSSAFDEYVRSFPGVRRARAPLLRDLLESIEFAAGAPCAHCEAPDLHADWEPEGPPDPCPHWHGPEGTRCPDDAEGFCAAPHEDCRQSR